MTGRHGMKLPPGNVVAPTYRATRTGNTQMPMPRANRPHNPRLARVGYAFVPLTKASAGLVDVLDTRASNAECCYSLAIQ